MNLIKNIEIKNFKSIRHQKLEDCRRVNVFVGYPNVGKSNILEAISLFGVNQQTKLTDLIRVKETPTIFFNGFIEDDLMVSLNDEYGIFGRFSQNILSLQFQIKTEQGIFEKQRLNPTLSSSVVKEMSFVDFGFASDREFQKSKVPNAFIVKKYEFQKKIASSIPNYSSLQYPFGDNIFSVLQTNKNLNKDVADLFVEYNLEFLYDNRERQFTILKRTESGIFTVPYELLADTLQKLIFYKAAIYSNSERVLLFEEPEAHMFPPYISKFTTDVMYDKNDNQFFINTHSPFVINDFMENLKKEELSMYVVGYKKESGETVIRRLSDTELHEMYQYGIDLYMNLENFLIHEQQ